MNGLDLLNLADVRAEVRQIIADQKKTGKTLVEMGSRNGHQPEFMRAPWDETRVPWDWTWSTLHGLVDGVDKMVVVYFHDLPEVESTMYEMGRVSPQFGGVGAMDYLKKAREALGVSQMDLANTLKIVKSGVYKLENSDDPRLSSVMRYARGLGGYARYRIEEYP